MYTFVYWFNAVFSTANFLFYAHDGNLLRLSLGILGAFAAAFLLGND